MCSDLICFTAGHHETTYRPCRLTVVILQRGNRARIREFFGIPGHRSRKLTP